MNDNNLFLGRIKGGVDVIYIAKNPETFSLATGFFSYAGTISPSGFEWALPNYGDIATSLIESDYAKLKAFVDTVTSFGYIESEDSANYKQALALYNDVKDIYDKLSLPENLNFYEACDNAKEYKDKLKYHLSDYDYELVLDDKDHGEIKIINVYGDDWHLGRKFAESNLEIPSLLQGCIDFSLLGRKLIDEEYACYVELPDSRIVELKRI